MAGLFHRAFIDRPRRSLESFLGQCKVQAAAQKERTGESQRTKMRAERRNRMGGTEYFLQHGEAFDAPVNLRDASGRQGLILWLVFNAEKHVSGLFERARAF